MLIDEGERLEQVIVPGVEGGRADAPLEMSAAVIGGQVVLVYASVDSIWALGGAEGEKGIALSPPGVVRKSLEIAVWQCNDVSRRRWSKGSRGPLRGLCEW